LSPAATDALGFRALAVLRAGCAEPWIACHSDLHDAHAAVTVGERTFGASDLLTAVRLAGVDLHRDDVVAWIDAQREAVRRAPTLPAPADDARLTQTG
jgi:hypothetical protein